MTIAHRGITSILLRPSVLPPTRRFLQQFPVSLCLAFVLTGSQSREAIAAGVSQWSAVR
jgi:hypothetical protein